MVMMMNKCGFVKELSSLADISLDDAYIVNDILESNFFLSKKNKDIIIEELVKRLKIDESFANKIYDISRDIILKQIKEKIKHPFGE